VKFKWYRAEIIERFMDDREKKDFDKRYESAKVVNIGKRHAQDLQKQKKQYG